MIRFLAELAAELITSLKLAALKRGITASELVQEAVENWLKWKRVGGYRKGSRPPALRRKQFLARLDARILTSIKLRAIETKVTAASLLEEAVRIWLKRKQDRLTQ